MTLQREQQTASALAHTLGQIRESRGVLRGRLSKLERAAGRGAWRVLVPPNAKQGSALNWTTRSFNMKLATALHWSRLGATAILLWPMSKRPSPTWRSTWIPSAPGLRSLRSSTMAAGSRSIALATVRRARREAAATGVPSREPISRSVGSRSHLEPGRRSTNHLPRDRQTGGNSSDQEGAQNGR
jgi:hypothetical protein